MSNFVNRPDDIGNSLFSVAWTDCGSILAIATTDGISLINCWTWTVISDLKVPTSLNEYEHQKMPALFIEMEKQLVSIKFIDSLIITAIKYLIS